MIAFITHLIFAAFVSCAVTLVVVETLKLSSEKAASIMAMVATLVWAVTLLCHFGTSTLIVMLPLAVISAYQVKGAFKSTPSTC